MLKRSILISIIFIGFAISQVKAQTTIWSVDFETGYSDNDETAQDNNLPTGADWTKTGTPTDWWRVEQNNAITGSFSMQAKETDGVMTWTSESISISGFTNVTISLDMEEVNWDNGGSDQMETFYDIGGGNVEFGDGNGDGDFNNVTNTISGLSGTTLTIVVTLNCNANNERGRFDNILVTGTPASLDGIDGPGGVGATDGTGQLIYWVDANVGVTGSSPITAWTDQSGNGVSNTISGNPALTSASLNGRDVITFDGTGDYITTNLDINAGTHSNLDVFAVYNFTGTSGAIWGEDDGGYDRFIVDANGAGGCNFAYATGAGCTDVAALFPASTPVMSSMHFDEDASNGSSLYIDGASVSTFTANHDPETSNNLQLAAIGTNGFPLTGDIAEVFVFSTNTNLAQKIIIYNYLSAKYNISLDANDLYNEDDVANGDFDYEVAGIGQASDGTNHEDAQGTGIVRMRSPSGLANSEFLIWGHDNGSISFTSADVPSGVGQILVRKWRASESGEVGTTTISFDLSSLSGSYSTASFRLIIDSDNDGSFSDESGASVISGATNTSGSIYEWTGVDIDDSERFTIGITTLGYLGPGGVGDTDGSGTLSLWLDANQGVTESSNEVTQWNDQSGYANHATPPAAANRPDYDATGTNSHPIITFDGTDHYLTASDDNSLDLTTWSIVIVGIVNQNKNYNAFVVKGPDAQENYEFLTNFPGAGNIHFPVYYTTTGRSSDSEAGETFSTSVYGVYQLDYDQTNFEIHIDGDQTETNAETRTPQTNSNELYIGNEESSTGREVDASIGEIAIYSSPLNDAQRIIVHNAMAAKYGFSLDANDNYDEDGSGFDFNVAGIGQAADGSNHLDAQGTGIVRINTPTDLGNSEYLIWGHDDGALTSFGETDLPTGVEARLIREWRASESGEVGTINITFDLSAVFGSITASDLRLLIDQDNDGLFNDETVGTGGVISGAVDLGSDLFQWTGIDIDNNERFTIGSVDESNTPLPIVLETFEARALSNQTVKLKWVTTAEINNDYFTLERSNDGDHWEAFATILGAGNSTERIPYEYVDETPYTGFSLYRLKQTDFDGKFTYSQNERINIAPKTNKVFKIYPNPGTYQITIEGEEEELRQIQFFNLSGQEVSPQLEVISNSSGRLIYNISSLKSGTYIIRATQHYKRFVKM